MLSNFELFRTERNPWGQELLIGLSWDLLWVFIGLALLFIVAHSLYTWLWVPMVKRRQAASQDAQDDDSSGAKKSPAGGGA